MDENDRVLSRLAELEALAAEGPTGAMKKSMREQREEDIDEFMDQVPASLHACCCELAHHSPEERCQSGASHDDNALILLGRKGRNSDLMAPYVPALPYSGPDSALNAALGP